MVCLRNQYNYLQKDLKALEEWASSWGMKFNATKCYVLSIKKKSNFYYQLNNTILKEVSNNPYLGLTISNLKWNQHINGVCRKASSSLGFIRRNLQNCPKETRLTAYLSLVRSLLEYGAIIWDPYTQKEIDKIERIQRQAARFITRDYRSREPGCVTKMLEDLQLPSLQLRRRNLRLQFFFKIANGLLPAIAPDQYLVPIVNKRKIKPKSFDNCISKNIVTKFQNQNSRSFKIPDYKGTEQYKNSFFVRTIPEWNGLPDQSVTAESLAAFKSRLAVDSKV
ncbi:MAG: hypothetical protein GY694_15840 [Gammaproteobacteria bacterium]|nr:hypothetical protein [Gammaproteobacteria bacterium]